MARAYGIAVIPNVVKVAAVVGGRRGSGAMVVRDANGKFSDPIMVSLTGGNVGWQIGVQSTDIVLVFTTAKGIEGITDGKLTLGADASVAAGPVGRAASAATDQNFTAEVYSYSRNRGLFAGVALDGSILAIDTKSNKGLYGKPASAQRTSSRARCRPMWMRRKPLPARHPREHRGTRHRAATAAHEPSAQCDAPCRGHAGSATAAPAGSTRSRWRTHSREPNRRAENLAEVVRRAAAALNDRRFVLAVAARVAALALRRTHRTLHNGQDSFNMAGEPRSRGNNARAIHRVPRRRHAARRFPLLRRIAARSAARGAHQPRLGRPRRIRGAQGAAPRVAGIRLLRARQFRQGQTRRHHRGMQRADDAVHEGSRHAAQAAASAGLATVQGHAHRRCAPHGRHGLLLRRPVLARSGAQPTRRSAARSASMGC